MYVPNFGLTKHTPHGYMDCLVLALVSRLAKRDIYRLVMAHSNNMQQE